MARVDSWILVDFPTRDIQDRVLQKLNEAGYGVLGVRRRLWRLRFTGREGDNAFAGAHRLDVRIRDQAREVARLDFRFRFPKGRPAHQQDVNDWAVRFRTRLVDDLYEGPVPGVVSEDGSRVEFDGPPPPFYRPELVNFLGIRGKTETRVLLFSCFGLLGFGLLFLVVYLMGELQLYQFICYGSPFLAFPLWGFFLYLRFRSSPSFPSTVVPTLDGIRLRVGSREQFVPWTGIVGKGQPGSWSASNLWEAKVSWRDDRGRIRAFQVSQEAWGWIDSGCRNAKHLTGPRREAYLAWYAAPPGTPVLVSHRGLRPAELKSRKLWDRFPVAGFLRAVYVTEETDRRIVRLLIEGKAYEPAILREIGVTALEREYWDIGEVVFRRILAREPDDSTAVLNLVGCLLRQSNPGEARAFLDAVLATREPTAAVYVMQSLVALAEGDVETARDRIGRAVELDPNNLDALHMWFEHVTGMDGLGQAVAELDVLTQAKPSSWGPPLVLAIRTSQVGDRVQSTEYFETALRRGMNDATVAAYLEHLGGLRDVVRMVAVADRVLASEARLDPETWFTIASVYKNTNSTGKAREAIARIDASKHPDLRDEVEAWLAEL